MLNNFFEKSNPVSLIYIFAVFVFFFLVNFIFLTSYNTIDFNAIAQQFSNFILLTLIFFYYNFILSKNQLTSYNSYGFLLFVLLFGFYPETLSNRDGIILNLISILFLRKVFSLSKPRNFYQKMFDSGFWLGILFLLEPPSIIFGLLIFVSIGLFHKLTLRTVLIPLTGLFAPLICYLIYHYHLNITDAHDRLVFWYSEYDFKIYNTPSIIFSSIFLGSLIMISIIFKIVNFFSVSILYRKNWLLTALNFLLAAIFFAIKDNHENFEMMILFFPISILITSWLEMLKSTFQKDFLIFSLLLGSVIFFIV